MVWMPKMMSTGLLLEVEKAWAKSTRLLANSKL